MRPLLHSGMPHKVNGVIAEVIERNDPALYDWILRGAYPEKMASSVFWQWRHDDTSEYRHPSLLPETVLKLVARGNSELAADLRGAITSLCVELGSGRNDEPVLDVSGVRGMTGVTKLRIHGQEAPNQNTWRRDIKKLPQKPVVGFDALETMTALEDLTLIGCAKVDASVLAKLPKLRRLEMVWCDVGDLVFGPALKELGVVACPDVTRISAPSLERLVVEDMEPAIDAPGAAIKQSRLQLIRTEMTRTVFDEKTVEPIPNLNPFAT